MPRAKGTLRNTMATYDTIPLSWNDPLFSDNVNSGSVTLPNGGTLSNRSITQTGSTASVVLNGGATLDDIRISSREGVRIGGSGDINISNSYLEATGQPGDHADTIQAYAPGSTGAVTITNTAIVAHGNDATAGMFIADDYSGTFTFNNVMFQGGPFGLRIAADADDIYVSLTNVYFVGPFTYAPFLFEQVAADIHITHWENVHYATIVNGELVPGALIQPPEPVEGVGGAPTIDDFSTDSGTVGDQITNDTTLALTGTAAANSTVRVYDGGALLGQTTANGSGAWSYITVALPNGSHSFTVTATSGGTTSSSSSPLSVTVDTAAPAAPAIITFSTDSGTVGDRITNDNTLTLTGTAAASSTVKLYDGATLLGQVTANGIGTWSYTTAALLNGSHSLSAQATDAAGNTSGSSTALNVTVDTVAPAAPVISSFSTDSGNGNTLNGTATANSTVKLYDGATLLGQVTANGSGAWSYTTAALSNGAHSLTATSTDTAGNTSASAALMFKNLLNGGTGNDYLTGIGILNTAHGNEGDDQLFFTGNQNTLFGDTGNDWLGVNGNSNALYGAAGNEWMGASGIGNTVVGGEGHDSLFAYGTSNGLYGETGNDWLGCSGNSNTLAGGAGSDWIGATGNNNLLDGGAGNDILVAAAGHTGDHFVFQAGYGHDAVQGFSASGGDIVHLESFGLGTFANLQAYTSQVGNDVVISFDVAHSLTLQNVQLSTLNQTHFDLI